MKFANTEIITINNNIEVVQNIVTTYLEKKLKMKKKYFDERSKIFNFHTNISFFSWGELITIELLKLDLSNTKILINSVPRIRTTHLDFGKPPKNINTIKNILQQFNNK